MPDVEALWNGAVNGLALTSSLIVFQDAPTQAAIRAALERKAAVYKTPKGWSCRSPSELERDGNRAERAAAVGCVIRSAGTDP